MKDKVSILVTGVGAPGTVGTIKTLGEIRERLKLVGIDINQSPSNRCFFDEFESIVPPGHESFLPQVVEICQRHEVSLILPQVTRELEVFAKNKDFLRQQGIKVLVNDFDALNILNNKRKLMQEMQKIGLPVPEFHVVNTIEEVVKAAEALGYPENMVVIKPSVSNGMRGLRILSEEQIGFDEFMNEKPKASNIQLEQLINIFKNERLPEFIVSEYMPGIEYTVDCLCDQGTPLVVLPRKRLKIRSGITFKGRTENHGTIIHQCNKLIEHLNIDNMVGFQFKLDEQDVPKILECNPRIQGTMVAGLFCKANVILGAVCKAIGLPYEISQEGIGWGVEFERYWGCIGYADTELVGIV